MANIEESNTVESESEIDDFNPEPAIDSDNEDAAEQLQHELIENRETGNKSPEPRRSEIAQDGDLEDSAANDKGRDDSDKNDQDDEREAESGDEDGTGKRATPSGDERGGVAEEEDEEEEGDEDDEDEEEDKDEEEEEVTGHRRKRHKRDARLQFIDVEAEVDDEDEELDDEDEDLPGEPFIAETHPDDLLDLPPGAQNDDRRHRELDRQRELAASMDAEKQAAALKERYGRNRAAPSDSVIVPQRLLLPSVDDPTIWGVRCKPGKEREVVFAIMKRFEDRLHTRTPLQITSAFERGGTMAGYVYIEAQRQSDILVATEGITFAYPRTKMVLIPVNEMPDLLRTVKSKSLEPGMYVRIKRGKYSGDLAQVDALETNGLDVSVRIVPRIDYGVNENKNISGDKRKRPGGMLNGKSNVRPPPRLFSEVEAKRRNPKDLTVGRGLGGKEFTYSGDTYIDGFLIKDFKIQHLQTEDVNPTLEEVTRFTTGGEDGTDTLDLAALAATLKSTKNSQAYLPGDMVEIYQGEQQGVYGRATAVHGDIVTIRATEGELRGQVVESPMRSLRKKFRDGDHVKVIGGSKYQDEVGMVIKVKDDRVTFLSDANNQEITVFSKDLREATDSGITLQFAKYDLYDLVQLDASMVACVIKVDRESLKALDQNGNVRSLLPSNISHKIEKRRHAVATDRDGSEIRNDDTVKEYGGEQKQGRILHIHRNYLFVQSRHQSENSGVFVVRNGNVTTVAAKGGRVNNAGPDLSRMNPALQRNGANGSSAMPPPRTFGRDKLIGKTVIIRKGPYKGFLGLVKDATDTSAQVELHARNSTVTVPKDALVIKDPITGKTMEPGKYGTSRGREAPGGRNNYEGTPTGPSDPWGGRTPATAYGGRTPAWGMQSGSRTPGWSGVGQGGRTPAWNQSSRTPAWGADGSRTVNPYADGSRTAYGGTSTWNPNSRTPYSGASGFSSGEAQSGSKTPAYGGGSNFGSGMRTPAHNSNSNSYKSSSAWGSGGGTSREVGQTPSAPYDAPTPGFAAPTPGNNDPEDAPTPRLYGNTPAASGQFGGTYATPGALPETPAPFTPAAVGDDDDGEPRYH